MAPSSWRVHFRNAICPAGLALYFKIDENYSAIIPGVPYLMGIVEAL